MNGNYGFNVIPNYQLQNIQPLHDTQQLQQQQQNLPFAVQHQHHVPDIGLQQQQQLQLAQQSFPAQNVLNSQMFSADQVNSSAINSHNGPTYFPVGQPYQIVQAINTPQGVQFVQVIGPQMLNPQPCSGYQQFCLQQLQPTQMQPFEPLTIEEIDEITPQDSSTDDENDSLDGGNEECCPVEEEGDETEPDESFEREDPIRSLQSMSLPNSNNLGIMQQLHDGCRPIFNLNNGCNTSEQQQQQSLTCSFNSQSAVQNYQSYQVLVPTPQGELVFYFSDYWFEVHTVFN